MRYHCRRNLKDAIRHPHGRKGLLSPVHTGDTHTTGDTILLLISMLSPVSPVSPVARARDGFRYQIPKQPNRANMHARENFLGSPGDTGDTGDTPRKERRLT
jgi:hypothetical protein